MTQQKGGIYQFYCYYTFSATAFKLWFSHNHQLLHSITSIFDLRNFQSLLHKFLQVDMFAHRCQLYFHNNLTLLTLLKLVYSGDLDWPFLDCRADQLSSVSSQSWLEISLLLILSKIMFFYEIYCRFLGFPYWIIQQCFTMNWMISGMLQWLL